jgi:hypothetical protein
MVNTFGCGGHHQRRSRRWRGTRCDCSRSAFLLTGVPEKARVSGTCTIDGHEEIGHEVCVICALRMLKG